MPNKSEIYYKLTRSKEGTGQATLTIRRSYVWNPPDSRARTRDPEQIP